MTLGIGDERGDHGGDSTEGLASRPFTGFDQAAAEAAASRMYGEIHFRFDNETGLMVGGKVGHYVLQHELLPIKQGHKVTV